MRWPILHRNRWTKPHHFNDPLIRLQDRKRFTTPTTKPAEEEHKTKITKAQEEVLKNNPINSQQPQQQAHTGNQQQIGNYAIHLLAAEQDKQSQICRTREITHIRQTNNNRQEYSNETQKPTGHKEITQNPNNTLQKHHGSQHLYITHDQERQPQIREKWLGGQTSLTIIVY